MARIRTIKPEFFTSEDIVSLTPLARLFYVSLWCESDREGRLAWKLRTLKMRYLPADDCDIEALSNELLSVGLVHLYVADGMEYAYLPGFTRHQIINNRESESVLPAPPFTTKTKEKARRKKPSFDASSTRESGDSDATEGKGREGKGKEGNAYDACEDFDPPDLFSVFWGDFPKHANRSIKAETLTVFRGLSKADQAAAAAGLPRAVAIYRARPDFQDVGWEYFKSAQSWLRKRCWEIEDDTPVYAGGPTQAEIELAMQLTRGFEHGAG